MHIKLLTMQNSRYHTNSQKLTVMDVAKTREQHERAN